MSSEGTLERLGALIESRPVRSALVVLIILSVLPYREIEDSLRPLLLVAFGGELLIRVPLLIRRRRRREVGLGPLLFLLTDVAAFVSFLPLEDWLHRHFLWLTIMRLSRLVVLLRFARDLAADLYSILTRREQLQQFGLVTVAVAALAFVSAVVLSQLGIPHDYDGIPEAPDEFWDRMWWSFRQLESADNLVANLHVHPLVGVLSLGLTVTGVFIVSFIIGIGTNIVEQVVRAERRRAVGYSGHTVVVGPIAESELLVREFVSIYRKNRGNFRDQLRRAWASVLGRETPRGRLPRMALLGRDSEAPAVLYEPGMRWVVYRQGEGTDRGALERVGAARAKRAILLADRGAAADADAVTMATLAAFREVNPDAQVFVELVASRTHETMRALAMESARTFPLDLPWYLGLFLLHHLVLPGVERLYQLLLTADGSELYTHIFGTPDELGALGRTADEDGTVPFSILAAAAERSGVVLIGVMLGRWREGESPPFDGLVPWVNPYAAPADARAAELGATAGSVPVDRLRGLIGVAETYQALRAFARALMAGEGLEAELPQPEPEIRRQPPDPPPRCILVVGYSESVASLALRLADMVEGARVALAGGPDGEWAADLALALAHAGARVTRRDGQLEAHLPRGGRLTARAAAHGDAMEAALEVLSDGPVEAVVFLAEPDAVDADARTSLRMLRLAEHLLGREGPAPHVLAELGALAKGERARAQIAQAFGRAGRPAPLVTLLSTEHIRHYFMVHSAFIPGVHEVYAGLLGARGQDIVRLPLAGPATLRIGEARRALAPDGMVALAFERSDGSVVLNPDAAEDCEDVRAIYAIGDAEAEAGAAS